MSSRRFLLRRVWHLAIPTPPAMGYSPTEYAEFTEPPAEMSSHGFHRSAQILRVRCSPTEFTEFTEFGSVGMAGMPYPPTSVNIRVICGRLFSARSFCEFRAFCGNLFPPTDFTDLHRYLGCAVLPQNSQNLVAWVWQGCHTLLHLCASVSSVGGSSLPEVSVSSVRSVGISFLPRISQIYTDTYGALFSHGIHGIHRTCQRGYGRDAIPSYICAHPCHLWEALLCKRFCVFGAFRGSFFTACSVGVALALASGKAERRLLHPLGRQRGYGRDAIPSYIRVICGRLFSARGSVYSVYSVGASSPLVRLVQQRLLHPLAESTEVVRTSHHLTISPSHHNNIISPRTQPSACLPSTVGMTSSPPAAR